MLPLTEAAPMLAEAPEQIVALAPGFAAGKGLTVTITEFVFVQPVAVMVSVNEYVVVTVGETLGLETVDVKPVGDDVQE